MMKPDEAANEGIWQYAGRLRQVAEANRVSLGEGRTPLVRSLRIGRELGLPNLYFKLESMNPTGSYKDRISALGVSLALEQGRAACIGTTSGNAGNSIAAYAARAGIPYNVYVQENIVVSKLEPMLVHGAQVVKVRGFGFDPQIGSRVFSRVLELAETNDWELLVTAYAYAPLAMDAVKTIAFELAEHPSVAADTVFVPVGGGGLLTGIYRGYAELLAEGAIARMPRFAACQSAGCANVAKAWKLGLDRPVPGASTALISGIQVPNAPDGERVLRILRDGDGLAEAVPDETTWHWQEQLAIREGIFCEPAGAIALAAAAQAVEAGRLDPDATVVCIVSGAGYKDADRMSRLAADRPQPPMIEAEQM